MMNELPSITSTSYGTANNTGGVGAFLRTANAQGIQLPSFKENIQEARAKKEVKPMSTRRLVRVLVVDPDAKIPTDIALLHDSGEVFTDKDDQELFFDVPIQQLLKDHNEKRLTIVDKEIKDRTEYLEEARIRDLEMTVITVAEF